jgi:hypothetical protein
VQSLASAAMCAAAGCREVFVQLRVPLAGRCHVCCGLRDGGLGTPQVAACCVLLCRRVAGAHNSGTTVSDNQRGASVSMLLR